MITIIKPIAFFDIEGTGTDVAKDRICSISILILMPDGSKVTKSAIINPEMVMSEEVIAVHGITNEMVADKPKFHQLAKGIFEFLKDCDLSGFNSNNYDIPLLCEEFLRCDIDFPLPTTRFIDVGNIFKIKEPRTLTAAYKFYCGKDLEGAHNADNDVQATLEVFEAQMEKYTELQTKNIEELAAFTAFDKKIVDFAGKIGVDSDGDYIYNIGAKTKGVKVKNDTSMAYWMMDRDFSLNTKKCLQRILDEIYPEDKSTPEQPETLF